jgi:hypothetical protein
MRTVLIIWKSVTINRLSSPDQCTPYYFITLEYVRALDQCTLIALSLSFRTIDPYVPYCFIMIDRFRTIDPCVPYCFIMIDRLEQ